MTLWNSQDIYVSSESVGTENPNYLGEEAQVSLVGCSEVTFGELQDIINSEELYEFMPSVPNVGNIFRNAVTEIGKFKLDIPVKLRIEKPRKTLKKTGENTIDRYIMLIDIDETVSDGHVVARLSLDTETGRVDTEYGPTHQLAYCPSWVQDLCKTALANFHLRKYALPVSDQQVRTMLYNALYGIGSNVPKYNGTWQIPKSRYESLMRLKRLHDRMKDEGKPLFNLRVKSIINGKNEEIIDYRLTAVDSAIQRLNYLMNDEMDAVAKSGSDKSINNASERFRKEVEAIEALIKEYEDILGDTLDAVHQHKSIVQRKFSKYIKSPAEQTERALTRKLRSNKPEEGEILPQPTGGRKFNLGGVDSPSLAL